MLKIPFLRIDNTYLASVFILDLSFIVMERKEFSIPSLP